MAAPGSPQTPRKKSPRSPGLLGSLHEKVPLMAAVRDGDLPAAYGLDWHATWKKPPFSEEKLKNLRDAIPGDVKAQDQECLVDYEPLKFSSFRVCYVRRGTIMESPVIIVEQILLVSIFFLVSAPVMYYFKEEAGVGGNKGGPTMRRFVGEQEGKMRAFAMIMTGLAAFLLSFYTSIIVARWWTMRTAGVGGIKKATVDLGLLLYQSVTQEEKILSAVSKYGRVSLLLIFMWRRQQMGSVKEILTAHELLDEHECDQLLKWNKHCLHETIWAWQMAIVTKLKREGKIKSDQLYALLLEKCIEGRAAVQLVHTHLAVRVPMQYVHLLGLLVKMHNLVLAVIMGILFGAAMREKEYVVGIQACARIFILPFLFNAILLINCDLADPFDGSEADFPGDIYQDTLRADCAAINKATDHVPAWLKLSDRPGANNV